MKKIFDEVGILDKRAVDSFFLSEDILMEHAAISMAKYIEKKFKKSSSVLIVCGSGNNGADGIALARLLHKKFRVYLYLHTLAKSQMAKLQEKRAKSIEVEFINEVYEAEVIVDCLFGTGSNKEFDEKTVELIEKLNSFNSHKIACDIPSGINKKGQILQVAFKADTTITMGGAKTSLFSDRAKDYVGKIKVANLGLASEIFQTQSNKFLLEQNDFKAPKRDKQDTNKGSFGHLNVIVGEKEGAGIISSLAAFNYGAGLVSIISKNKLTVEHYIMQSSEISTNCTALAIGMGLGDMKNREIKDFLKLNLPKVLDADILHNKIIFDYLDENCVLTPHPKEFVSLLKLANIANISVNELQDNRFFYVEQFVNKFPKITILLKGANMIIAQNKTFYINTLGSQKLAKGGSGDVLSGIIASLLAQGYSPLESTIQGSLALSLAAKKYKKSNYSLNSYDLIEKLKSL